MKKIILVLITGFCVVSGFAQQFPLQSQYQFNYSSINPAAVGEFDYLRMVASYRNQWTGFNTQNDQAIATQYVTFTKGFGTNGLGLTLLNDNGGGMLNTTGFRFSYSHKIIYDTHKLFLGLSGGGSQVNLNLNGANDIAFSPSNSDFLPEATFGAYVLVKDWRLGFSVPGMLNENYEFSSSSENQVKPHFYTMISYTKELSDDWSIHPSILLKNAEDHQQLDANLNVKLKNKVWFGASYRTSPDEGANEAFGPSFYLGVDLGRLFAMYSHDISSGKMSSYPTHEITIGYDFRPLTQEELNKRKAKKEETVNDSDNDGVVDSLDLCPNLAGSAKANGCPDFDEDGIPDKYDLCPALPGSFEAGCPDLTQDEKGILKDVLNNLEFSLDSDRLKRSSYSSLSKLSVLLIQNPAMFLEVHGYASSEGETSYNLGLSARRAKAVENFLLSKGVDRNALITRFSGEDSPIASNNSEFGRSKNRRVELSIKFHLKNDNQVVATENAYTKALEGIGSSSESNYTYKPDTYTRKKSVIIQSDEEIIVEEVVEEIAIPEANLNNTIEDIDYDEDVVDYDETVEVLDYDEDIDIENIDYDAVIDSSEPQYLLVVQTFVSKENAVKYIDRSSEDLNYKKVGNRYYVYVYSSPNRDDVIRFRSLYKNECWIKAP